MQMSKFAIAGLGRGGTVTTRPIIESAPPPKPKPVSTMQASPPASAAKLPVVIKAEAVMPDEVLNCKAAWPSTRQGSVAEAPLLPRALPQRTERRPHTPAGIELPTAKQTLRYFEIAFAMVGGLFLLFDFLKFCSLQTHYPDAAPQIASMRWLPSHFWWPPKGGNFWHWLGLIIETVGFFAWNGFVFLLYLSFRSFLTNVGLWMLLYFTLRYGGQFSGASLHDLYASQGLSAARDQKAFGDADYAPPSAIHAVFAQGHAGDIEQRFED